MSLRMIESIKRLRVTPTQKLVLFCLADCHNGDTGRCDPSYAYIMQVTGLSNRAVATALQALRAAGQLRFDSRNGSRSSYQITPHDAANGALPSSASSTPAASVPPPPAPLPPQMAPTAASREHGAMPPVQDVHTRDNTACEPAAASRERSSLPPVNVDHINRNEPEETGSTGGKPPGTDKLNISAPPCSEATTRCAAKPPQPLKPRREDWRDWHREQARRANAAGLPLLAPPEFAEAWARYRDYRTRRATEARIATEAIAWTLDAAEAALRLCERHAATHGWPAVLTQMDTAIQGRWQGLNFQTTNSPPPTRTYHANPRPTPACSDTANTPGRYA